MSDKTITVLHHDDQDGFASAWVCYQRFGKRADYIPVNYGTEPPDCTGKEVYIVDFSFPGNVLLNLAETSTNVVVLDHHEPAWQEMKELKHPRLKVVFDNNLCGATLAWQYFFSHEGSLPPWFLGYVQDRDLWTWKLPFSREVNAYLDSLPREFSTWNDLLDIKSFRQATYDGVALVRHLDVQVERICAQAHTVTIGGQKVQAANTPLYQSEVADKLALGKPFGAVYYFLPSEEVKWSLRSRDGTDVSAIARQYGGNGHKAAAGFRSPGLKLI